MFTGIIEEVGTVSQVKPLASGARKITVKCRKILGDLKIGDSLAVNGVCLTIVGKNGDQIAVEAVEETVKKTMIGALSAGNPVNLERSVRLSDRLGGHLVQGHVDTTGKVVSIQKLPMSRVYGIRVPRALTKYLIPVGSVSVNGVSLTVAEKMADSFKVAIIPHTFENTNFKSLRVGDFVNIEIDMIAKYVESLLKR
jgi:riboflavin synthase